MASRLELQTKLEELLGSRNVYYQPPTSVNMGYPAIVYSKSNYDRKHADNGIYTKMARYELIVISKTPDNPIIEKLMELPYCSYDRHYSTNNLHHDSLTLYY